MSCLVETSVADSRFVAGDQQDGLALGVEGEREQLILHFKGQCLEFRVERRMEADFPSHGHNMLSRAYGVKRIPVDTIAARVGVRQFG